MQPEMCGRPIGISIVTFLDNRTGSDAGVGERFTTALANMVKIRGANVAYRSGEMKITIVNYTRRLDVPFTQFLWFGLRSGVGNVVRL
jgi:hypothetical protein